RRDDALRVYGRISAAHADGEKLGDFLGDRKQPRHRLEGTPHKIGVESGNNHALAEFGESRAIPDDAFAEELSLVNADYFRARGDFFQNLAAVADKLGGDFEAGMGDDAVFRVTLVDRRLENLNALLSDF